MSISAVATTKHPSAAEAKTLQVMYSRFFFNGIAVLDTALPTVMLDEVQVLQEEAGYDDSMIVLLYDSVMEFLALLAAMR